MLIEKSPFYKTSSSTNVEKTSMNSNNEVTTDIVNNESDEFSFWSWFKGLVNPLQNLPLISGIYSSVNSEDESSDRDLVQNSLGGFLYGGPIGAIAGFGSWIFNKLFENTPTEFALDFTGISKIWKDEENDSTDIANLEKKNLNSKEIIAAQNQSNLTIKKNPSSTMQFSGLNKNNLEGNQKINVLENNLEKKNKLVSNNIVKEKDVLESNQNFDNKTNVYNYKQINFSYPSWQPHELSIQKFKKSILNKNIPKNQYMEKSEVESLNLKINA